MGGACEGGGGAPRGGGGGGILRRVCSNGGCCALVGGGATAASNVLVFLTGRGLWSTICLGFEASGKLELASLAMARNYDWWWMTSTQQREKAEGLEYEVTSQHKASIRHT